MRNIRQQGVLKSYVNFQLLDHLKDSYEKGNEGAKEVIESFAKTKSYDEDVIISCISCKETTLSLLAGMIFFVRSNNLHPPENDRYIWYKNLNNEVDSSNSRNKNKDIRVWAISVIRNAIAHWDEEESGVKFLDSATEFKSRAGSLVLQDKDLHYLIMQLYGYAQK